MASPLFSRSPASPRRAVAAAIGMLAALVMSLAPALGQSADRPEVRILTIDGPIGPATADYIEKGIEEASDDRAAAVIIEMDTPGGLVESTRLINKAILASRSPVIVFVGPSGARAASAGAYILYASHVAAMAPGTNVGAATPINLAPGGGGGDDGPSLPFDLGAPDNEKETQKDDAEKNGRGEGVEGGDRAPALKGAAGAKAVNDLAASIRALAELRGRNPDLAERMVREAVSIPAMEALEKNVIDMVVESRADLLAAVDGVTVETVLGAKTIDARNAEIVEVEPSLVTKLLGYVTHPNVAFLLMGLGFYGIIIEFWNPGSILPGAVGAISLILGLYALSVLPVSTAAAALMLLGAALAAAEFLTPTFGALAAAGLVAFSIGGVLLFPDGAEGVGLSRGLVYATIAGFVAIVGGSLWVALRGHARQVTTGEEGMTGATARVLSWSGGEGVVHLEGERWRARGPQGLQKDDLATVEAVDGLTLDLRRGTPSER